MPGPNHLVPLLLAVLLGLVPAPAAGAQDPVEPAIAAAVDAPAPRETVAGRVVARDGSAWAGATVVLTAHTTPCAPELGDFDRVEVTTSERGIFRASVLAGLAYTAFARQPLEDGTTRKTGDRHGVVPGALVTLQETDPEPASRITLRIPDGWDDLAPFSLRITQQHPNHPPVVVPVDADGVAEVPVVADGSLGAEVLDKHGEPLYRWGFTPSHRRGRGGPRLDVPPPVGIPVRVTDEAGEPIAGAEIRYRVHRGHFFTEPHDLLTENERQSWRTCGVTDAEGRATVRAPTTFDPFGPAEQRRWREAVFAASAPGRMQAHSGHCNENVFWNGTRQTDEVDDLLFVLREAKPKTGRILLAAETPLVGARVLVTAACKMNAHQNGWTHLNRRFVTETDAEGRWTIPDFPADGRYLEVNALLPLAFRQRLAVEDLLPGPMTMFPSPADDEEPVFDLSELRPLQVEVQGAEAGPAVGAQVEVFPLDTADSLDRDVPWIRRVDRRGRVLLQLLPGAYGVLVARDDGWVSSKVEVPERADATPQLALQLEAWPTMRLRVLGPDGEPPATVSSYISSMSMMGGGNDFDARLRDALQSLMSHFGNEARWEDGILTVRCMTVPGMVMKLRLNVPGCQDREVALEPNEGPPVDVVLERSK